MAWQPVAKVARSLLASLGRALRCRDSLVFQSILLRLAASVPAQCRGAPSRGPFATGCQNAAWLENRTRLLLSYRLTKQLPGGAFKSVAQIPGLELLPGEGM